MKASTSSLSLRSTFRSERIKLRSLRATAWLICAGSLLIGVLGPVQSLGQIVTDAPAGEVATVSDALAVALSGLGTAGILFGIAGTIAVTSEYPRSIRTTFTAVPRRSYVVLAKAATTAAGVFVASVLSTSVAVVASSIVLAKGGFGLEISDPLVLRAVLGASWYAVVWALLGQLLGWLLRSAVGAMLSLLALMFVAPALVTLLPTAIAEIAYPAMPSQAIAALVASGSEDLLLSPTAGFAVANAYLALGLLLVVRLVTSRDA